MWPVPRAAHDAATNGAAWPPTDDERDAPRRSRVAAGVARARRRPDPWVGCGGRAGRRPDIRFEGATAAAAAAPTPRSSRSRAAGAAARGRHRCTPPSSRARTTAARRRAPTRSSTPASRRVVVGLERSRPEGGRPGHRRGCATAGIEVDVGVGADEVAEPARALPHAPPHRPALRGAEAGGHARRPHRGARRHQPVDHRRRGPADAHRLRADSDASSSAPAPSAPTTRRSPSACPPARPTASSPLRVVLGHGARRRQVQPCLELDGRRSATCSTSSARGACSSCWSRAAPTVAARLPRAPGWSTATSLYLAPALFGGDDARGLFAGAGRADHRRRLARPHRRRHADSGDDLARSTSTADDRDRRRRSLTVHRHRRGARHGRVARRRPAAHRGRRPCSTTSPSATRSRSTAAASPSSAGTPTTAWWEADVVDETFARTTSATSQPGDPVNLERPVRLEDRLGGHLVQGHVDARRRDRRAGARPAGPHAGRAAPLRRREGLDHRRRRQPHRRRRRSTTASPSP